MTVSPPLIGCPCKIFLYVFINAVNVKISCGCFIFVDFLEYCREIAVAVEEKLSVMEGLRPRGLRLGKTSEVVTDGIVWVSSAALF